jgi:hypothetical protein
VPEAAAAGVAWLVRRGAYAAFLPSGARLGAGEAATRVAGPAWLSVHFVPAAVATTEELLVRAIAAAPDARVVHALEWAPAPPRLGLVDGAHALSDEALARALREASGASLVFRGDAACACPAGSAHHMRSLAEWAASCGKLRVEAPPAAEAAFKAAAFEADASLWACASAAKACAPSQRAADWVNQLVLDARGRLGVCANVRRPDGREASAAGPGARVVALFGGNGSPARRGGGWASPPGARAETLPAEALRLVRRGRLPLDACAGWAPRSLPGLGLLAPDGLAAAGWDATLSARAARLADGPIAVLGCEPEEAALLAAQAASATDLRPTCATMLPALLRAALA